MKQVTSQSTIAVPPHAVFVKHPQVWEQIRPQLHRKTYQKDELIISHGDAAEHLWLVFSGWVKLTRQTPDGKETITGLCTEGDVFGEAALFQHANYPYNAEAIGQHTELAAIPAGVIRSVIANDASLSASVMSLLNDRMSQAQLKLEHMSTLSAAQRLGCFLLNVCRNQADGKKILQIPVEKHVLASYLGMKPETFSRSQQQLKEHGVSLSGHQIIIDNIANLREFVCNSCSESGMCDSEEND